MIYALAIAAILVLGGSAWSFYDTWKRFPAAPRTPELVYDRDVEATSRAVNQITSGLRKSQQDVLQLRGGSARLVVVDLGKLMYKEFYNALSTELATADTPLDVHVTDIGLESWLEDDADESLEIQNQICEAGKCRLTRVFMFEKHRIDDPKVFDKLVRLEAKMNRFVNINAKYIFVDRVIPEFDFAWVPDLNLRSQWERKDGENVINYGPVPDSSSLPSVWRQYGSLASSTIADARFAARI